ncbi:hypothetical protein QFC22_004384 [Naganishia vaughanmartiniae]|uniref:Uncharacterized protein n=1 Tax=Naganishia vaughanmartiniae TaxID=1424756 RepID=A0ACC2X0F5_9TREE|nr:hypothetical protein QFC22_004384 [Naganishia vaughanmartiniae]
MTSLFSSRLTSAYTALRGDLGAPQNPTETIDKLVERIQTSPNVDDRRTAVLGLKGCIREYKQLVGERALGALVAVLQYDAPNDAEIAKAVLETLMGLMEVGDKAMSPKDSLSTIERGRESVSLSFQGRLMTAGVVVCDEQSENRSLRLTEAAVGRSQVVILTERSSASITGFVCPRPLHHGRDASEFAGY